MLSRLSTALILPLLLVLACDSPPEASSPDAAPPDDAPPPLDARTAPPLELAGTFAMSEAADLSAEGSLVAVSRYRQGAVALIDASDPADPVLVTDITGIGFNADVELQGDLLFINHEGIGFGIDIYDVSVPAEPVLLRRLGAADGGHQSLADCHNVWPQPDRDLLYCASTATFEVAILSIGEGGAGSPAAPVFLAALSTPGEAQTGVHDMYALGDRLYVSYLDGGFAIYDIADPAEPGLLAHHTYEGMFNHNVWPSADGAFLFTSDERLGGHLRVFDIRDLEAIEQVGEHTVENPNSSIHNVEVEGDTAYISWYTEGVRVLDVSDPSAPTEIAADDFVDVVPDPLQPFTALQGNWGVEPEGDVLYVSSMKSGLRIYRLALAR